jgi:hypothetical protein
MFFSAGAACIVLLPVTFANINGQFSFGDGGYRVLLNSAHVIGGDRAAVFTDRYELTATQLSYYRLPFIVSKESAPTYSSSASRFHSPSMTGLTRKS